jgi:hypothetical protein
VATSAVSGYGSTDLAACRLHGKVAKCAAATVYCYRTSLSQSTLTSEGLIEGRESARSSLENDSIEVIKSALLTLTLILVT